MNNLDNQEKAEALYKKMGPHISEDSIRGYNQCLELNPKHILALWKLGTIYDGDYDLSSYGQSWDEFNCGDRKKAIDCFQKIIEIDPKYSQAYSRLGKIYFGSNNEKALGYFLQYLNLNPQDYNVIVSIGEIYSMLNKKEEAVASFTKCIAHNQKDSRALHALANIYEGQGDFKGAFKCLEKCLEIHHNSPRYTAVTHAQFGRIYDKMGNIKEAMNSYRKCNQLNADHKQANAFLKHHLTKQGKY